MTLMNEKRIKMDPLGEREKSIDLNLESQRNPPSQR